MATVVIRNLEESIAVRLMERAARHGRGMEEEVCDILRAAVEDKKSAGRVLGKLIARSLSGKGLDVETTEWREKFMARNRSAARRS